MSEIAKKVGAYFAVEFCKFNAENKCRLGFDVSGYIKKWHKDQCLHFDLLGQPMS